MRYDPTKPFSRKTNDPRQTTAWQRFKRHFLALHPICQNCRKNRSQTVHHVIPLSRGGDGSLSISNKNAVAWCHDCHKQHHDRNPLLGRGRKPDKMFSELDAYVKNLVGSSTVNESTKQPAEQ